MQVPRQLGEVAAFGGSNVEPSVRSCFEKVIKPKNIYMLHISPLTLLMLNTTCPVLANSVGPDQLASEEAN